MRFLFKLNKRAAAIALVQDGLASHDAVSSKQIRDCTYLTAESMGDSWEQANVESAAGMVLMALAKNSALQHLLNACGWKLVLSFLQSFPRIERDLSCSLRNEIRAYQTGLLTAA